ncbi:MAG TPA: sulfatase-like hydrolase/transferase [Candidatus Bathyarchaeia archaeon]|nr:sulfatase-like hydrolase/transferase [Candidatus Bathyarchaeia archaeon]
MKSKSSRRFFLQNMAAGAAALATGGCRTAGGVSGKTRPNVLFILTDDQREDTVGALRNAHIHTPHLDELARGGVVFTNAYCMGGFSGAVCLPSRMMVLRGRSWFSVRDLPAGFANLPSSMGAAGYQTFHVGKMGNTDVEVQALFEESLYVKPKRSTGPLPKNCDELVRREGLPGEHVTDSAIDFLGRRDKSRPFFMYLAGPEPHDPRVAPTEYLDLYDVDKIPLPPNFLPRHPFDNGELAIRDEQLAGWPRTEREIREHLRDYYAVITYMDVQFGRIFQALKDSGEYENTIIVFSSDQGIAIGSHGLMGKQNLYEHSMGVPLIFAGPGIPRGKRVDAFAYLFDVFPTLCELVGAPAPAGIEGKSLAPVIRGKQDGVRNTIFLAYRDVQRAVRKGDWKLIRYPKVDKTQLFNLHNDPYEMNDLAADGQQAQRVKELLAAMKEQQRLYGDTAMLNAE